MFELLCQVLSFERREYKSKTDGSTKVYSQAVLRKDGKMFRIPVRNDLDLTQFVDKEVVLSVNISTFGNSIDAIFRIDSVVKSK